MKAAVADQADTIASLRLSGWFAVFDPTGRGSTTGATADRQDRLPSLRVSAEFPEDMPQLARNSEAELLFDGFLFDGPELSQELGLPDGASEAQIALGAYDRWGDEFLGHLRGHFAIVLLDRVRPRLIAGRDHLGMHPLFYAEAGESLVFASQVQALFRHPGVPNTPNRVTLAERLCSRYISAEETVFAAVRRLTGGSLMVVSRGARRVARYWDPAPPDRPIAWTTERELERFDETFERAVRRCVRMGRPGVFLSGGLDSISVAAIACDVSAGYGMASPMALSLAFPHPECAEEETQSSVAGTLGIDQELIPFDEAVGRDGLLQAAVAESSTWPFPLCTIWIPAYRHLSLRGRARGCRTILTGRGGDERLGLSLYCAADMLRAFDVPGLWLHLKGQMKSYRLARRKIIAKTLWTFGAKPLLSGVVDSVAHNWWRRRRLRRFASSTPAWVAADPTLRKQMDDRVGALLFPAWPRDGFHAHDIRINLTHPLTAAEFEESHELARRVGMRIVHPFWDPDLVDLLYRMPPALANGDGAGAKKLIRDPMERRFPGLGLEQQKKVTSTNYFRSLLHQQSAAAWQTLGGAQALGALDIVDRGRVNTLVESLLREPESVRIGSTWDIMNVESWARAHLAA